LKINFLGVVPESQFSSRNIHGRSVLPSPVEGGGEGVRQLWRLRVLCSLPPAHQEYLFERVRILCRGYIRDRQITDSELTPEELVSETFLKLLGTVSMDDNARSFLPVGSTEWSIAPDTPERDDRVKWLIRGGRRIVQPGIEDETDEPGSEPDLFNHVDAYNAWQGLLLTANDQFPQHDDASMLLRLLNDARDILGESSGQWPIRRMVALLNELFPPPTWTDDRVDNAKRRLVKWIKGLMQKNGLDATDLEALFAGVARRGEDSKRVPLTALRGPKKTN
jgi:hypothetical protein